MGFVFVGLAGGVVTMLRMRGDLGLRCLRCQFVLTFDRGGGGDTQDKQHDKKRREHAQSSYRVDDSADFHRHQFPDPNKTGRLFQNPSLARVMNGAALP